MAQETRIYIVEDDSAIRQMLSEVLREGRRAPETFPDGRGVLEQLRQSAEPVVVLLDLNMPFVTGMDILFAVGADPVLAARHHFIVITASRAQHLLPDTPGLRRLRYTWLVKPFHIVDVIAAVDCAAAELRAADQYDALIQGAAL